MGWSIREVIVGILVGVAAIVGLGYMWNNKSSTSAPPEQGIQVTDSTNIATSASSNITGTGPTIKTSQTIEAEKERIEKERQERERIQKEKLVRERKEAEERKKERIGKLERERKEAELKEKHMQGERQKQERIQKENERLKQESMQKEKERLEQERMLKQERIQKERERLEQERMLKQERMQKDKEKLEQERMQKENERLKQERIQKENERLKQESMQKEKERLEKERMLKEENMQKESERQKQEQERIDEERERQKQEQERIDKERERQKQEQERIDKERERQKQEQERIDKERERLELERIQKALECPNLEKKPEMIQRAARNMKTWNAIEKLFEEEFKGKTDSELKAFALKAHVYLKPFVDEGTDAFKHFHNLEKHLEDPSFNRESLLCDLNNLQALIPGTIPWHRQNYFDILKRVSENPFKPVDDDKTAAQTHLTALENITQLVRELDYATSCEKRAAWIDGLVKSAKEIVDSSTVAYFLLTLVEAEKSRDLRKSETWKTCREKISNFYDSLYHSIIPHMALCNEALGY